MIPHQISLGPLSIHLYGLIIAVSIFLGWLLAKKRASLYKIPQFIFEDPILLAPLILAIIGARLYHVLDYWSYYSTNWTGIIKVENGGLGIFGALLGIFLGFWIIAKIKKINLWSVLDLLAPSLLLGQAFGRIANFINQEGFGPPTSKPWGIFIDSSYRPPQYINATHFHPTFFYEAILDGMFFIILLFLSKRLRIPGQLFGLYLILYTLGRFIVEFWRIDTWMIGEVKVAHVLSMITFLVGIWIFQVRGKKSVD